MVSSWGLTETSPTATSVHYQIDRAGIIGLPVPGTELKLVPKDGKFEMRLRGPNITPGYWKRPDFTQAAFDEEGFFLTGDAGAFADPDDPSMGVAFDGRLGENFKLSSGTWVHVGALRVALIAAAAPLADDIVVTGHDRDEIGLLVFPNVAACRSLCVELPPHATVKELIAARPVREALTNAFQNHNAHCGGASSMRAARAMLMEEPPSLDANEITDKGYINQRACCGGGPGLIERLYQTPCPPRCDRASARALVQPQASSPLAERSQPNLPRISCAGINTVRSFAPVPGIFQARPLHNAGRGKCAGIMVGGTTGRSPPPYSLRKNG